MSTSKMIFQRKSFLVTAILLIAILASVVSVVQKNVSAAATGPCDIYASGGTPCVAAHSTVRALFGAYNGNLYQVKRASDSTTLNIGLLSAGGYVNAAAQDTFCAGTTCTIVQIYDQTTRGNHLTVGPAGGAAGADTASNATAAKITINGHEAYGVLEAVGNGYRRNNTSGIATGDSPEGMYAIFDGTRFNTGCCYDYGNAETNNLDDGNGTMEAIYFGNSTTWGRGAGTGPWVMADMENGLFSGVNSGLNNNDATVNFRYLTAIVKGAPNLWAIKTGNAQSGNLTTQYSGVRPSASGYNPMKKQGAIILGIGGDNSHSAIGTFYEGAMTSGYPSDATENSVQANIVAAGYGSAGSGPTPTPVNTPTGGTNLAQGKTATSDSFQAANPIASGNDGNTGTRFCAANGNLNHWWTVDLGASHNLTGSEVMWEFARNYKYKVEVSTDNTNWTLKVDKTGTTGAAQTQNDPFTATARYVRITITGLPTTPTTWASFYEFRVFGN